MVTQPFWTAEQRAARREELVSPQWRDQPNFAALYRAIREVIEEMLWEPLALAAQGQSAGQSDFASLIYMGDRFGVSREQFRERVSGWFRLGASPFGAAPFWDGTSPLSAVPDHEEPVQLEDFRAILVWTVAACVASGTEDFAEAATDVEGLHLRDNGDMTVTAAGDPLKVALLQASWLQGFAPFPAGVGLLARADADRLGLLWNAKTLTWAGDSIDWGYR